MRGGADSAWLGIFRAEKARESFVLPEHIIPVCVIELRIRTADYTGTPCEGANGYKDLGKELLLRLYSLIETASENGLDPYRYLCWGLKMLRF